MSLFDIWRGSIEYTDFETKTLGLIQDGNTYQDFYNSAESLGFVNPKLYVVIFLNEEKSGNMAIKVLKTFGYQLNGKELRKQLTSRNSESVRYQLSDLQLSPAVEAIEG